jgi:hypothetical protein
MVEYFTILWMECYSKSNTLSFVQISSQPAMEAVQIILGLGVGLGLAKKRPTKAAQEGYF